MIDKIDASQIQNFLENSPAGAPGQAKNVPSESADASLQVNYADLINGQAPAPEADAEIIQQAQELLSSGELESPQNIREAADNIVKLGI